MTGKWGQSPCQVRLQNRPGQKRLRTGQLDPDTVSLAFPSFFLEKGGDDQGAAAPRTALWGAGGQGTRCADVAPPLGNLSSHTGWSSKPGHCLRLCSVTAASSVEGPEATVCTVSGSRGNTLTWVRGPAFTQGLPLMQQGSFLCYCICTCEEEVCNLGSVGSTGVRQGLGSRPSALAEAQGRCCSSLRGAAGGGRGPGASAWAQ